MLAKGRCKHQVDYLSKAYDLKTFIYLTTLDLSEYRLVDHEQCSQHPACTAYNANIATYITRHTTANCICSMVSVPYQELTYIISRGQTPLVSIENGTGSGGQPRLRVLPRSRKSKYIAISDVWADGLGNPKANALHLCQVQRLSTQLTLLKRRLEIH
ncbi:hypothetical protein F5Y08DRAFT_311179, partial [Xylaria arbuscula]